MPELPEVETTRRGIEPHVKGRRVSRVWVRQPILRWPVSEELGQALTGKIIEGIGRRAKYLLFRTGSGQMMVHLGMSGSLRMLPADTAPQAHDHIDILLDNDRLLRFTDPRRFGSVFWIDNTDLIPDHWLLDELGPEPLSDDFDGDYLFNLSRGRKTAVKTFLMNSHVVVGVGNIYANEALFDAGIRPDRLAGRISLERYRGLADAVRAVLNNAIAAGGTTLRDFVREDGSPGYFRQDLKVYGRGDKPCLTCGRPLKESRLGQRTTVFCQACQR